MASITPINESKALIPDLTSRHIVIRDEEDQKEFDELQAALLQELDPQGATEAITFRELLHAAWTLQRLRQWEAHLCNDGTDHYISCGGHETYERLNRYQVRAQRAYYRALAELRTLQTNRALRTQKLADPDDPKVPAITDMRKMTKQTQSKPAAAPVARFHRDRTPDFRPDRAPKPSPVEPISGR